MIAGAVRRAATEWVIRSCWIHKNVPSDRSARDTLNILLEEKKKVEWERRDLDRFCQIWRSERGG